MPLKNQQTIGQPHLGLLCNSDVPDIIASDFKNAVAADGLDLLIEKRESPAIYAGVEWLMPTAIIAYVAKSYFDGFLKEMGKEHYVALKAALKGLALRLSKVTVTQLGTPGKVSEAQPYSLVFSICFDREPEGTFKFLIPTELVPEQFDAALASLFEFMQAYLTEPTNSQQAVKFGEQLAGARPSGGIVLLGYNLHSKNIEIVDPLAKVRSGH